jgi:hypothetical protein
MLLYSMGCSHTAGTEIEYAGQPHCHEKAYAGLLAKHFNWQYVNDSQVGGNNKLIVTKTIKFVENYLEINKNNELIVLVGWTSVPRSTATHENKQYYLTPGSIGNKWWKGYPRIVRTWWNLELQLNGEYRDHVEELIIQMIVLHGYLQSKKIKHIFVNTIHYMNRLPSDLVKLVSTIPYANFHMKHTPWYAYLKEIYPPLPDRLHHLPEEAHQHYADLLIKHIEQYSEYFLT